MATDTSEPHRSPLHARHTDLGAKLAPFGGWEMPLEYAGVVAEHKAVRSAAGLFDVSHLGKVVVTGPGAAAYVNATLTNDLDRITTGQAQYTLCCDQGTGGIVDDLIVYLLAEDHLLLVPNAANSAEVVRRLQEAAPAGVEVRDEHHDHAILAVQGPASDTVLVGAGFPTGHDYMSFTRATLPTDEGDVAVTVCRTGYTGERGYELVCPAEAAGAVWDAVLAAGEPYGIQPAGLGARDTLRTEMGYPLHGQDIGPEITPVQARLGWAVGWKKETFFGADALRAEKAAGPTRTLRGLKAVGRGIPRPHMTVLNADGESAGEVTSGTFSPTLKTGIALALVDPALKLDDVVTIDIRGRASEFVITKPPFVTPGVKET